MTRSPIEPLSSDIAALLAVERRAPPPPDARAASILARVEMAFAPTAGAAIASATMGSTPASAATAGTGPLAAGGGAALAKVFLLAAVVAGGTWAGVALLRPPLGPRPTVGERPAVGPPQTERAVPADGPAAPPVAVTVPVAAPRTARAIPPETTARPMARERARADASDLAAESELLERARASLARGDTAATMRLVSSHRRIFPRGHLVEEREALHIRALALAGDRASAHRRAESFRQRYPTSLQLEGINEALRDSP